MALKVVEPRVRSTRTTHRCPRLHEIWFNTTNLQICKSAKNTLNSPEFQLLSMERHDCPFAEAEPLWLPMVPGGRVGSSTNVSVQGEANSNFERDLYNCTFPTLIGDKKIKSKYISLQWYFKQTTGGSSSPSLRHLLGIFCTLKFWISL